MSSGGEGGIFLFFFHIKHTRAEILIIDLFISIYAGNMALDLVSLIIGLWSSHFFNFFVLESMLYYNIDTDEQEKFCRKIGVEG